MVRELTRGLRKRCPRCGGGRLFERWLTMKERCPTCDYRFEQGGAQDAFFLGAMALNIGLTEGFLAVLIAVSFALTLPDPPIGLLIGIAVPLMVLAPIAFYPFSRTLWAAIDLVMRRRLGRAPD
ncbi:MAG TPA: DUF983 domain-containing protein [Acidimicrobiales bacterium]|nr:DUF983 domain-containing protein [Acidimicrobiales bacterium]